MNFIEALKFLRSELSGLDLEFEVSLILQHISKQNISNLKAFGFDFSNEQIDVIKSICKKRKLGEPLAYILKTTNFYGLDFDLDESCLIPRFDSESLIENLLKNLDLSEKDEVNIIDICSGSGCLGIALCDQILRKYQTKITIDFLDISKESLLIAEKNAHRLLPNSIKTNFIDYDILSNYKAERGKYDIIVSNPPYIKSEDIVNLEIQVRDFEPKIALDGGFDGLIFYRKLAEIIPNIAKESVLCGLEFGINQEGDILKIFESVSANSKIYKDLSQINRGIVFNLL